MEPEVESRTQGSRPRKVKDTKKFRGQVQTLSRPRPRTKNTGASVLQEKDFKNFFKQSQKKQGVEPFQITVRVQV